MARGATERTKRRPPHLELLPTLFPQRHLIGCLPKTTRKEEDHEIVTKRFVFGDSKIAELRKRSIIDDLDNDDDDDYLQEHYPAGVIALSALIWGCLMDVDQPKRKEAGAAAGGGGARVFAAAQPVNLRTRMVPPFPINAIGNMCEVAMALSIIDNHNYGDECKGYQDYRYSILVRKIRESISKMNYGQVRELIESTDSRILKSVELQVAEAMSSFSSIQYDETVVMLNFSNFCGLPLYEADFGWGKPSWVSVGAAAVKNSVWFTDTSMGDGIEALVSLSKEDMAKFERHRELLKYSKNNTNFELSVVEKHHSKL